MLYSGDFICFTIHMNSEPETSSTDSRSGQIQRQGQSQTKKRFGTSSDIAICVLLLMLTMLGSTPT